MGFLCAIGILFDITLAGKPDLDQEVLRQENLKRPQE